MLCSVRSDDASYRVQLVGMRTEGGVEEMPWTGFVGGRSVAGCKVFTLFDDERWRWAL